MSEVWVDISADDRQVKEYFDYAGYKVRDMREPLEDVLYTVILANIEEQFRTEGALSGGWEPLTDDYRERKEARYPGKGILRRTDFMEKYLFGDDPGFHPWRITRTYLDYSPDGDPKVEWHQYGVEDRQPGGRLPARPIITWGVHDDMRVQHIFEDWLDKLRDYNARRNGPAVRPDALPNIGVMI